MLVKSVEPIRPVGFYRNDAENDDKEMEMSEGVYVWYS